MRLQHRTKKVMALVIAPLSFLIFGYALLFGLIQPAIRPLLSIYDLISSEYGPNFGESNQKLYSGESTSNTQLDLKDIEYPKVGSEFGKIEIKRIGLETRLYYGDSENILLKGVGLYQGSFMPGFNKTTLIAGHTIPYFQKFGKVKAGDEVDVSTHYGKFTYKVTDVKIGDHNDGSMYDLSQKSKEQLILYTCYPLDGIGFKDDRLFVYADKIAGPDIKGV